MTTALILTRYCSFLLHSNRTGQDVRSDLRCQRGQPPVVLTQHIDLPYRRFLLISAQGLVHLRLPNPLVRLKEHLAQEVSSSIGSDNGLLLPLTKRLDQSAIYRSESGLNLDFLTNYLYQFSPDEAISAALFVGAAYSTTDGAAQGVGVCAAVEQVSRSSI